MARAKLQFDSPFESYVEVTIIGEGGAGRVYEVQASSGPVFALKCLAADKISADRRKRFKNEIAFCQRAQHQHILRVLDTGLSISNGVHCPFYVMPRYDGTLRSAMSGLGPDDALRLFAQVLDGVEAAHKVQVWHRDLKPENILWEKKSNTLVVADFGIAHFEADELYTAVETKDASRLANFLYSAPEQRTRGSPVDHRADIFALGLMLNELYTGKVPQGVGYRRIVDISPKHAYLDGVVDQMIQDDPRNRLGSIEEVKKVLIGHRNVFVSLQELDKAKGQVVKSGRPPDFEPISIVGVDYRDAILTLMLSRNVPHGWADAFRNPRRGSEGYLGYEVERFTVDGNTAKIGRVRADEQFIQGLVNFAKRYVDAANEEYVRQEAERFQAQAEQQRVAIERQTREAEIRSAILKNVKL